MSKSGANRGIRWVLGGVLLLILVAALVGLFFVNYLAALLLLAGIVVAWLLRRLVGFIAARIRSSKRRGLWIAAAIAVPVAAVLCGVVLVYALSLRSFGAAGGATEPTGPGEGPIIGARVTAYRVTVKPSEALAAAVLVDEQVMYDITQDGQPILTDQVQTFAERRVFSTRRGFLLREISFEPLDASPTASLILTLPDETKVRTTLCTYARCPAISVRLADFPRRTFFAARSVAAPEIVPYVNTETISYSLDNLDEGVTFAYITPPFQALRPLLSPLIGASNASEWLVGLVGLVGTVVGGPLVKPVLENVVQDRLQDFLSGLFKKKDNKKKRSKK